MFVNVCSVSVFITSSGSPAYGSCWNCLCQELGAVQTAVSLPPPCSLQSGNSVDPSSFHNNLTGSVKGVMSCYQQRKDCMVTALISQF